MATTKSEVKEHFLTRIRSAFSVKVLKRDMTCRDLCIFHINLGPIEI